MKAVVALLLLQSCGAGGGSLTDRYAPDALDRRSSTMRDAPIIFVGVVQSVKMIGPPRPATADPHLALQLYKARCAVELSIRGTVPQELEFWYFGPNPQDGMAGFPKFWLQPTQRRIFFAERVQDKFRAVGDFLNYTEWVWSGRPASNIIDPDPGKTIAGVMLTPGNGVDAKEFAEDLPNSRAVAEQFSSSSYTIGLLENLVLYPHPSVRGQACRILTAIYRKQSPRCNDLQR